MHNIEKETVINFNEGEPAANVYTYNVRLRKRLQELKERHPGEVTENYIGEWADYDVPKSWIRINPPRQSVPLTEQQKQERRDRLPHVTQK